MKILLVMVLFFLFACKATKIENTTYRVETAKKYNGKSVIKFEGLNREFVFDTDTLKKGDLVYFAKRPDNIITVGQ